ncbi:helix-turn-helix domain-containing protein [Leifsonia xyli]|uniref:helix-turn-helix domain-containing protein n=1 Tax=Leifsonia xyli TaxID=1575 RepID=UPI003D66517E
MTVQRTKGVDSARRALQILLQFSQTKPELTVDELIEAHDISLPSAYRYISLLREMYLIEERTKGRYVLSPQILQLAQAAERTLDYRVEAQPILDQLREATGRPRSTCAGSTTPRCASRSRTPITRSRSRSSPVT